jgi:hypothetical protein
LFISHAGYTQNIIKGNLKNEIGKPVDNVNLILYTKTGNTILAYTVTSYTGDFTLNYTSSADSLRLEITSLNYAKKQLFIANKNVLLTIEVQTYTNTLPEIIIEDNRPIVQKSDTINYNVKSFADKTDRVIIDVIKNLPGIKVTESGQILYQNTAINKFYIDGKDLLEDRYSIVSNNLPIGAVDQIQVLENHQPIKMLDGIEQSDRAAINIKLSKDAKLRLLGNGNAGVGFSPFWRDSNIALLKFNKNIQYINTFKNNNIGLNLDNELNEHNFSQNLVQSSSIKRDLLNLVKTAVPPIDAARYWFNNNSLINSNYLIGLNKVVNLKFNVGYEYDEIQNNDNAITNIFLPDDTIKINESHKGERYYNKFLTGLILEANTKKVYLKDNLKFQRLWSVENDFISSNGINQTLRNPFVNLINDFSGILNINDNLLGINSFLSFTNLPQRLSITPGQYNNILNEGQPYDEMLQFAQLKEFFNNNTISYSKKLGAFNFNSKAGLLLKIQELNNNLNIINNEVTLPKADNFENVIERSTLKIYDETSLSFIKRRLSAKLGLNLNFNALSNNGENLKLSTENLFINPNISFRYAINSFWDTNISVSIDQNISYLSNSSFILQNYRSLVNSKIPLYRRTSRSLNYSLNYKNIINAVFANFGIIYGNNLSNVLLETKFNDALITQTAILQNNPSTNLNITANVNKYYLALKTSIDFNLNYGVNYLKQMQKGVLTDFESKTIGFGTKVNTRVIKAFSFTHNLELTRYKSTTIQMGLPTRFDPITFFKQNLSLNIFMPKDYTAKLVFEHYYNNANHINPVNYYFADITLQKSIVKPKIDFSVILNNAFNVKSYTYYSYDNNFLINSNYVLRGRMLMFKVGFQF